jgi:hypothetical protein
MQSTRIRTATARALTVTALMGGMAITGPEQAAAAPMDAICYVAGIGASIWPIGTLIAGPTAIGCIVYYLV